MVEGELHHPTHTRHLDAPFDQVAGRDSQIKIDTHLALVRFNEKVRLWLRLLKNSDLGRFLVSAVSMSGLFAPAFGRCRGGFGVVGLFVSGFGASLRR